MNADARWAPTWNGSDPLRLCDSVANQPFQVSSFKFYFHPSLVSHLLKSWICVVCVTRTFLPLFFKKGEWEGGPASKMKIAFANDWLKTRCNFQSVSKIDQNFKNIGFLKDLRSTRCRSVFPSAHVLRSTLRILSPHFPPLDSLEALRGTLLIKGCCWASYFCHHPK